MNNTYFIVGDLVYVKRKDWEEGKIVGVIPHKNIFRGYYQTYLVETKHTFCLNITEHNTNNLVLRHE